MTADRKHKVYLRGDGGKTLGWGHINRLVSLAFILKDHFCLECLSGQEGADLFRSVAGDFVDIRVINDESVGKFYDEWPVIPDEGILVIDGYHFDAEYRAAAKLNGFKIVLIDDFATGPFNYEDLIINHAPDSRHYYDTNSLPRICCGIEYALLRPDFYKQLSNEPRDENQILISMGGADPNGLTYKILNSAGALFPEYHWIAVCTKSFGENWLEKLGDLERQRKNISIKLQLDAAEMHRLMLESGMAIVSSSTVLIEAWASGLYPAAICYTENQQMIYQGSINTDMAFPLHTDDLTNGLEHYLKGKQRFKGRTNEWNPPLCILHAMQELTAS